MEQISSNDIFKAIILFMILVSFIWVILFSWNPAIVSYTDCNNIIIEPPQPDPTKCIWASIIFSVILEILIIVIVKISRKEC